jgi:hypothetical protein
MSDNNVNVFISSKNRDMNSSTSDFTCSFDNRIISCNENQGININVISFDMLNNMYNINNNNNRFNIIINEGNTQTIQNINIINGSYSVVDLMDFIASQQSYFRMDYVSVRNRFIFTKTSPNEIFIQVINCGSFLGFNNGDLIPIPNIGIESYNLINMVYYNKILLRVNNIDFEIASIENINHTQDKPSAFDVSNILLWLSKNDIAPNQVISYNNTDGGNSYCYNLYNKNISSINFMLTNEYNELIEDAPDWTLCLQFTIYEKRTDEMVRELGMITGYLREIYVMLNIFLSYLFGK